MKKTLLAIFFLSVFIFAGCAGCSGEEERNAAVSSADEISSGEEEIKEPINRIAELLDYQETLEIFAEGTEAEILDVETGITYMVRRVTGGYNTIADVETLTWEDTSNLIETAGGEWNVRRRAVIVTVDGRKIAASIAPFEHSGSEDHPFGEIIDNRSGATGTGVNLDSIRGNGMVGVVDVYFFNSLIPGINRVDERHQEMVLKAYDFEG